LHRNILVCVQSVQCSFEAERLLPIAKTKKMMANLQ
jgi:hypothetical protein